MLYLIIYILIGFVYLNRYLLQKSTRAIILKAPITTSLLIIVGYPLLELLGFIFGVVYVIKHIKEEQ